jgi:pimeloyl-ACP methyl ester carboxylesterase/DNA-binding CsgD family transcriptional regulator
MRSVDVRYATTTDGVRIAYSVAGSGPPLVVAPGLTIGITARSVHNPDDEGFGPFYARLEERHAVIRYDQRGLGYSDRGPCDISIDTAVEDLRTVISAAEDVPRLIFGISLGGQAAARFAATYPELVDRLVIYGTFCEPSEKERSTAAALADLCEANWGVASQTMLDLVDGTDEVTADDLAVVQRRAAEPRAVAGILRASRESTAEDAARITPPTLVIHSRDDRTIPFRHGRQLASLIPHARLLAIAGEHNFTLGDDAGTVPEAIIEFLAEPPDPPPIAKQQVPLSEREVEVLQLVASGKTNQEIADALVISVRTAANHVSHILAKTGLSNRTELAAFAIERGYRAR